jgi:preprotein translocase subunit YajC
MTTAGLYGTLVTVDDESVLLETSPGVTSRWARPAIARVLDEVVDHDEGRGTAQSSGGPDGPPIDMGKRL